MCRQELNKKTCYDDSSISHDEECGLVNSN
jgi:hypothetical protein